MNHKQKWAVSLLVLASLILVGCGSAIDQDRELLIGKWELSNIDFILSQADLDIGEYEEYVELGMSMDFDGDGTFSIEISMMMDLESIIADMMGAAGGLEIETDQIDIEFTMGGTFEIVSQGELLLNFDEDTFSLSPEEFCFTFMGIETCQNIDEFAGGFDEFEFYEGEGVYYEVDEGSLTIWDDICDYPEEESCAVKFSK